MVFNMEKYEVNKFIDETKKRLNDIYDALNIKDKKPLYESLKAESEKSDSQELPFSEQDDLTVLQAPAQ